MVLVDTSVWIQHLRTGEPKLVELLENAEVFAHPLIVGELSCGSIKNRSLVLASLRELPAATLATHQETLQFIESRKLWSKGIGWIDAHLLASALMTHCPLWTLDERLKRAARDIGVGFDAKPN